jgi:HemY protein
LLYTQNLIYKEEYDHAESILRNQIKKNWHADLIQLYAEIENIDINKQLKFIESLKKIHPKSAELYQSLGILSKKLQLWGKAKDYLQTSSKLKPTEKTFFELGDLYRILHNEMSACENYEKGLAITIKKSNKLITSKKTT